MRVVGDQRVGTEELEELGSGVREGGSTGDVVCCDAVDTDVDIVEVLQTRRGSTQPRAGLGFFTIAEADRADLADRPPVVVSGFHIDSGEIQPVNSATGRRRFAAEGGLDRLCEGLRVLAWGEADDRVPSIPRSIDRAAHHDLPEARGRWCRALHARGIGQRESLVGQCAEGRSKLGAAEREGIGGDINDSAMGGIGHRFLSGQGSGA